MTEVFIFAIIKLLVLWHINMPDMKKSLFEKCLNPAVADLHSITAKRNT